MRLVLRLCPVFLYLLCRQCTFTFNPHGYTTIIDLMPHVLSGQRKAFESGINRTPEIMNNAIHKARSATYMFNIVPLQTCDLNLISIFQVCLGNWRIWVHPVAINHKPRSSNSTLPAGTLAFRVFVCNPRTPQKCLDDGAAACCWSYLERNVFRHTRSHDQFEYVIILFCNRLDIRFGLAILCSIWRWGPASGLTHKWGLMPLITKVFEGCYIRSVYTQDMSCMSARTL